MIVTDAPQRHPDVPVQKDVIYESLSGGTRTEMRVHRGKSRKSFGPASTHSGITASSYRTHI